MSKIEPSIQIKLHRNECIELHGVQYYVEARLASGYLLVGTVDRFHKPVTTAELLSAYDTGSFKCERPNAGPGIHPDFAALPIKTRKLALKRAKVVKEIIARLGFGPYPSDALASNLDAICKAADHSSISVATARRWIKINKIGGHIAARVDLRRFAPKYRFGRRGSTLGSGVETEISKVIDEFVLKSPPVPTRVTYDILCARLDELNALYPDSRLQLPSRATYYRRVSAINDELKITRQVGPRAARAEYEIVKPGPQEVGPYAAIEIDHTPVNCLLTTASGIVIGRPWLLAAIDRYSRMCVGFIITFEPPTGMTIMLLLRNIMLGKDEILRQYPAVTQSWPPRGRPFLLIADNGFEFHKMDLTSALAELCIGIEYCATRDPQRKGRVERFFLTLQTGLINGLPGVTFGTKDDEYDPSSWASLTADKFTEFILRFVVDIYHHRSHDGISKQTPYKLWNEYPSGYEVDLSVTRREIDIACLYRTFRTIKQEGISLGRFLYHGPEARRLRVEAKGKGKFEIRYNPLDLGSILVLDPSTKQFVSVAAVSPDATGMTVWQKRETLKHLGAEEPGTVARVRMATRRLFEDARRTLAEGNPKKNIRKKRRAYRTLSSPAPARTLMATQFMEPAPEPSIIGNHASNVDAPLEQDCSTEDLDGMARRAGIRARRRPS